MVTVLSLTEGLYLADLVKEEPLDRNITRGLGTISSAAAAVIPRFMVLGTITSSGKYLPYNPGASDGTQNASAVLLIGGGGLGLAPGSADARSADVLNCVLLARGPCVIDPTKLQWGSGVTTTNQKNAALAALLALGIVNLPGA
jgi:hypothetical protein